jgi:hypothetical protein
MACVHRCSLEMGMWLEDDIRIYRPARVTSLAGSEQGGCVLLVVVLLEDVARRKASSPPPPMESQSAQECPGMVDLGRVNGGGHRIWAVFTIHRGRRMHASRLEEATVFPP